ncbi:MAG: hypothetical protein Q8K79_16760 [Solirubrobacteraceae bacterium]|nr:hypothetical protein [Solirubrobacteraceae bacterium]
MRLDGAIGVALLIPPCDVVDVVAPINAIERGLAHVVDGSRPLRGAPQRAGTFGHPIGA